MVKIGDNAPETVMEGSDGQSFRLADFKGKKIVLYFYAKDMTSGCSEEARDFRDNYQGFEEAGAVVIGVSKDSKDSHRKFIEKYQLPFILVSDPDLEIIKAFDVWKEKNMYGKKVMGVVRTTFVIDENSKISKIYPKVKVKGHAEKVLADLYEE